MQQYVGIAVVILIILSCAGMALCSVVGYNDDLRREAARTPRPTFTVSSE